MDAGNRQSAEVSIIYVPCGSEDEAARIARALLGERLIACGNIYRSRSIYEWKGEIADQEEHLLLCKTAPSRAVAAEKRVRELHSYEVPCILRIEPARANYDYASWVNGQVSFIPVAENDKRDAATGEQAEPLTANRPKGLVGD